MEEAQEYFMQYAYKVAWSDRALNFITSTTLKPHILNF